MGKRGLTLLELVIACAIMAFSSVVFFKFMASSKQLTRSTEYDYTAVNLLRELVEWGSTVSSTRQLIQQLTCAAANNGTVYCQGSTPTVDGYPANTWYGNVYASLPQIYWPFTALTVTPGAYYMYNSQLLPKAVPTSLSMYYISTASSYYTATQVTVSMRWQDVPNGPWRYKELSVIPLSLVNDQFTLDVTTFNWEKLPS
ncbi:MAG: hypothetical protein PHW69_06550 [Elusimicrobiaceae bacterium]|nr:hypothetical protein [Elusimicrobiaceae bacterium]